MRVLDELVIENDRGPQILPEAEPVQGGELLTRTN
jgi:hypothetical protein